jgi:ribosome-binding protein aMBF1 (putative translation factor)
LKGKQLGEVFDDYFSAKGKLQNAIMFPEKDAKPEEVKAFLSKMGIPLAAEEYGLDPKKMPGMETEAEKAAAAKSMAEFFRSAGLTKGQGEKTFGKFCEIIKSAYEAEGARRKSLADTFNDRLLKETGSAEASAETAEYFKRALVALGDKALVQELDKTGMLYSTAFVRGLAAIWKTARAEPPLPQAGPGRNEQVKDALPKGDAFNNAYGSRRK